MNFANVSDPSVRKPRGREEVRDRPGRFDPRWAAESRECPRQHIACCVWLVDCNERTVVRCRAENLSETGLFVTAPLGHGLRLGQRYEIRVASDCNAQLPGGLAASLGYGTVRRTRLLSSPTGPTRLGIAIGLDLRQFLPV